MYGIFFKVPRYDNRDGLVGWASYRDDAFPYSYETLALALRKLPSGYDEDGQAVDIEFFVADLADPYRKPVRAAIAADAWEDIPF